MSPSRLSAGITSGVAGRREQQRERRVDQLRLVRHVGMALGGRVHLLLQHPLVGRADGVLRAAEDLRARPLGLPERELGDRAADPPLDPLGAERDLVLALALAPLLRAVGVADRHPDDRDRRVDAAERDDAGNAPAGADDHLAADLLAQDPVRRADVAARLGRDRRRLQAEPVLADRRAPPRRRPRSCVARRFSSERSKRGNSSSSPITSGASTRSASSSSSCPVSSPSSTTIVRGPSAADDTRAVRVAPRGWRAEVAGGARGRSGASATSTRAATGSTTRRSSSGSSRS